MNEIDQIHHELGILFEEYWKTAPVFPIPEEHERHKIASKTAFTAGVLAGMKLTEPRI